MSQGGDAAHISYSLLQVPDFGSVEVLFAVYELFEPCFRAALIYSWQLLLTSTVMTASFAAVTLAALDTLGATAVANCAH